MDSQAFNIITVLAHCLFIHLIIPKNQSISIPARLIIDITDYKQNLFAYITIKHYTPKEFYGVIIDIGASKQWSIWTGADLARLAGADLHWLWIR